MTNKNNIGEAILILGLITLNLLYQNQDLLIISIIICILPLWTWHSVTTDKETKKLLYAKTKLEIEKIASEIAVLKAKADYYNASAYEKRVK